MRVGVELTPDQARSRRYARTSWGAYVPRDVDRSLVQQRIIEVAAALPPQAVITGWAACLLHGAAWFDGLAVDGATPLPVPVALGPRCGVRRHPGIAPSFEHRPAWESWTRYGVRVARPERAVFDEMRRRGEREALVALDTATLAPRLAAVPAENS
ncbi:hypothetical protein [Nocardioides hwasunensis]|uniref:Uncharacterized protein n=1 Tax=Nocardioides hwasunensis TaxID=397258 RepID=A0ABR8MK42_9ACTN|nr:hypothetical protein [Nocardioides hwasunensis]MBD3916367.1 hypothetical protein [Nocardioides hwasunensis]